ncbi:MAG TPA: ribonuclease HII, partial [Candidatus Methylomirabilis sp.]|nr:ribonuclease HII [Candidatus Methylomirabilis sp.]
MTEVGAGLWEVEAPSSYLVAGVDEAGRGCLAGPVVAAAVILRQGTVLPDLTDSKLLTPAVRSRLAEMIYAVATTWAVAAVEAEDIDATDILRATLRAMTEAVRQLAPPPDLVLVDGNVRPHLPMPARAVIQGDLRVPAISAASILAKVTRDRLMEGWALRFPAYGFAQHKGYGTVAHRDAILRYGLSPIHRRTFAGIKEYVEDTGTQ